MSAEWCYTCEEMHGPMGWGDGCVDDDELARIRAADPRGPVRRHLNYWRLLLAEKSYLVRPYDSTADRRRWFWRRPARCGLGGLPDWVRRDLIAAVQRHVDSEERP